MFKSLIKPHLFCYSHTPQTIATTVTVTPAINIANDADFHLLEIRMSVEKAASVSGSLLVQLSTSGGDQFSNVGLSAYSFASMEQDQFSGYPIRLPEPIVIPANTTLNVQITNNNGETVSNVQLQLWGYKKAIPGSRVQ